MSQKLKSSTRDELLHAEDLLPQLGIQLPIGTATMSETAIREFATQWDPLEIHVGDGAHFGTVIASGIHTIATYQRLAVDAYFSSWAVVAARRIRDLVLPRPVFPGDTLTGWVRLASADGPKRGMVKFTVEGHLQNQDNLTVLTILIECYVKQRESSTLVAS